MVFDVSNGWGGGVSDAEETVGGDGWGSYGLSDDGWCGVRGDGWGGVRGNGWGGVSGDGWSGVSGANSRAGLEGGWSERSREGESWGSGDWSVDSCYWGGVGSDSWSGVSGMGDVSRVGDTDVRLAYA